MITKKSFKYVTFPLLGIVTFVTLYLLCAFSLSRIKINEETVVNNEIEIFIKTNGVHTDIIVPVKNSQINWTEEIKYSHTKLEDTSAKYLALGWGDKGFYLETPTWADLSASVAFNAAFGLSTTAIHATFYREMIENDSCIKIIISKKQYERLIKYILNSFQKNSEGHLINIKTNANYSNADAFYEANGSYSMFHTCNTWANNALKSCGQKSCLWTPFDTGIFLKYNTK
jgi:uncharacterized protein (TIGR02117 family)